MVKKMKWTGELIFDKITSEDLKRKPLCDLYGIKNLPEHLKIAFPHLQRLNRLWLESSVKVTDDKGRILGFAIFDDENEVHVKLEMIYILSEYRRKGIGTMLFRYCAHSAAENGKPMYTELDPTVPWLMDFYKKADPKIGFEQR